MKWVSLSLLCNGRRYFMSPWTGALMHEAGDDNTPVDVLPRKLQKVLELCDNPYKMLQTSGSGMTIEFRAGHALHTLPCA